MRTKGFHFRLSVAIRVFLLLGLAGAVQTAWAVGFNSLANLGSASMPQYYNTTIVVYGTSPGGVYTMTTQAGSSLPPGLALIATNDPTKYILGGVPTAPGNFSFTLVFADNLGNSATQTFTLAVSALYIVANPPNASTQMAYSSHLAVYGGTPPYHWSSSNMPAGLSISDSGLIAGTPLAAGIPNFNVTVLDSSPTPSSAQSQVSLVISPVGVTLPGPVPYQLANEGTPFSLAPTYVGAGPFTYSFYGTPPYGLTMNPSTGAISGTPQSTGAYDFYIQVQGNSGYPFQLPVEIFVQNGYAVQLSVNYQQVIEDVTAGLFFSQNFSVNSANNGVLGPISWSVPANGALPPGLSLVSDPLFTAQAHITGTPTTPGTYLYAIQYTDGAGNTVQQTYQLKVSPMAIVPGSAPLGGCNLPAATSGTLYRQGLLATGVSGFTSYSILGGTLPIGFSLDPSGVISGTTGNNGTFGVHLYASNASGSLNRVCQLNVNNSNYPNAASILAFENTPDPLLNSRGLYVQPMPRSVGALSSVSFTQYGGVGPVSWSFAPGSQVPPGMTLAPSGDYAVLSGVPTLAGAYTMTLVATDGDGSVSQRTYTVEVGLLSSPGVVVPAGQVGLRYSYQIQVLYGTPPYTFGLDPASFLPAGLSLVPSGLITGTPLTGGTFQLSMFYHVTDANGYATSSALNLPIITATQAYDLIPFSGLNPPDGSAGVAYTSPPLTNWVQQGIAPYTFALAPGSSLPNGLSITTNGAGAPVIAGTPTQTGDTVFTLTVTDGRNRTATTQLIMYVRQMRVTPASLPPGATGTPYLQTLTAAGGMPPYTFAATNRFSVTPGLGCPGLTLSGSGVVSGTPTQICNGTAVVVVTDSASPTQQTLTLNYPMSVGPPGTAITVINATPGSVSTSWTQGNPPPSPIPVQVTGAPGSVAFTVSTSVNNGSGWLSAVPTAGSTPGIFNIVLSPGPAALALGTYTGTVTVSAPNAYNSPIYLAVTLVVGAPVTCSYTVSPVSTVIPSSGGSGDFFVNTQAGCAWTAGLTSAPSGGIAPTSSLSGTGPGTVTYTVPNPSSQVNITSGVFQVGDQSNIVDYTVYQQGTACSFVTTPSSITAPGSGGPVTVNLSASNSSCPWNVSGALGWLGWIAPSPASGTGGGSVTLTLSPNSGGTLSTTLSIGGATLPVTQSGASCTGSLSPATDSLSSTGGAGRPAFLTIPGGCSWSAAAPSWVTITSAASGSGTATLIYSVAPNSSLQGRSGNIQVAGQTLTITETGVPCSFSVAGDGIVQPSSGGSGSISVGANGSGCPWVASSNTSWITLNPAQGNGNGATSYTAASNSSSSSRTGTVTVAGQSLVIAQSGTTCSVTLASSEADLTAAGGQISISVQAPSNCGWSATDGDSWVTLQGGGSGVGNGTILYQIGANASSSSRASTVSISPGASFNIIEAGAVACTYTALYAGNGGGPASIGWQASVGTFNYNASPGTGCVAAQVQSFSTWLSLSSPPTYTSPTGTVNFAAATNNSPAARTGYIMTGGSPYVVAQAASPCTYALGTMEAGFSATGGPGSIAVTASPSSGCTPYISADPLLGSVSLSGSGSALTVNYTVPAFTPFLPTTRILTITIGGQAFSVKQVSN